MQEECARARSGDGPAQIKTTLIKRAVKLKMCKRAGGAGGVDRGMAEGEKERERQVRTCFGTATL